MSTDDGIMQQQTLPTTGTPVVVSRRGRRKKRQRHKSRMITGYIIYASEIRKEVIKKCPDRDFGYISKIVGLEWKNLSSETKLSYEKRAQEQNEKTRAIMIQQHALAQMSQPTTPPMANTATTTPGPSTTMQHDVNIQQHQQTTTTTFPTPTLIYQNGPQSQPQPLQFMSMNINYCKPATVKLRPRDIATQTDPIEWVQPQPVKKQLKLSQTFIDYLNSYKLNDKNTKLQLN